MRLRRSSLADSDLVMWAGILVGLLASGRRPQPADVVTGLLEYEADSVLVR